jgi:Rps23 Pro-64 3,4-dihydroxylase Tpa1-like proline 4-hydroxylase
MRERLVNLIVDRLAAGKEAISADFRADKGVATRFTAVDDLLPNDIAFQFSQAFPKLEEMRFLDSFRERKYTSKSLDRFNELISDITFAFQDQRVIDIVADITDIKDAVGDPHLYAGGISAMAKGHFLNPHLDNSHDGEQKYYRVLNLLYYVSPDWKPENGGNLELWDERVRKPVEVPSLFNRLVLMSTNDRSWHSVNEVRVDRIRYCISNYYFSPHSPNGYETSHVTYFMGRPEQKVRRMLTKLDSEIRTALRGVKKSGFSKKDIYEGPPK